MALLERSQTMDLKTSPICDTMTVGLGQLSRAEVQLILRLRQLRSGMFLIVIIDGVPMVVSVMKAEVLGG